MSTELLETYNFVKKSRDCCEKLLDH